jgi:hypothetical protein
MNRHNKGKTEQKPKPRPAVSKRRIERSREIWMECYMLALESTIDEDKELTEAEATERVQQACTFADLALEAAERRWEGV